MISALLRRKWKKFHGYPVRRVLLFFFKCWAILVSVPAVGLFLLHVSRLGGEPDVGIEAEIREVKVASVIAKAGSDEEKIRQTRHERNLNRLEPTTRIVAGVRERCLKLLPADELQELDIPMVDETDDPVRSVIYISETVTPRAAPNFTHLQKDIEDTRFNRFTGYQTIGERQRSFQVNETSKVHCGFYSKNGGFMISDEDKSYMKTCKIVVSTCSFGGGDDLYQPIGMTNSSLRKVCYVAFWDEITRRAQELLGHNIDEHDFVGKWRVVIVKDLPFADQRLNGKVPKMLGHRLFPSAKYSIWVDSKSQFRRDPIGVLEALLWRSNSMLAISAHGARSSVYDEAHAVIKKHKASPGEVETQLARYRQDGFSENKKLHGKKALNEASVIIRRHAPVTNLFMCLWFNEVVRFTSRDQLSFPYVLWRFRVLEKVNVFPVCIRKDLVNSMGHIRKVKPLVSTHP